MKRLLTALLLIAVLVALTIIGAYTVHNPVPVTLTWGTSTFTTQQPVVLLGLILALVIVFYLGEAVSWLTSLWPRFKAHSAASQHETTLTSLATGFIALDQADTPAAKKAAKSIPFTLSPGPLTTLITLLHLRTGLLVGQQAEDAIALPVVGPLVAATCAQHAATHANWAEVRRLTTLGLTAATTHPILLTLHAKALLNLNDPAIQTLLPRLKPLLGPTAFKLLTTIITTPTSTHARLLDDAWVKAFQTWLPTPSSTFPLYKG